MASLFLQSCTASFNLSAINSDQESSVTLPDSTINIISTYISSEISFSVTGSCSDEGGEVSASLGTESQTTICSSGQYNVTLAVNSLPEGSHDLTVTHKSTDGLFQIQLTRNIVKDLQAPTISIISLPGSPESSSSTQLVLDFDDDRSGILSATCTLNGSPFTPCGETINLTGLSDGEQTFTIKLTDRSQNESAVETVNWIVDTTDPIISITTNLTNSSFTGGASVGLQWNLTEDNITSAESFNIEYTLNNGTSWSSIGTVAATDGPLSSESFSETWILPASTNSSQVRVRISITDLAGNSTTATTGAFTIDSTAPTLSLFELNSGVAMASGNTVPVAMTYSDTLSGVTEYQISTSPTFIGATWRSTPVSANYTLPFASQTYTVYARVRDAAGNVSSSLNDTIELSLGTPPVVNITSPSTTLQLDTLSEAFEVGWNINSQNPLSLNGISIGYTLDNGLTVEPWPGANAISPTNVDTCTPSVEAGTNGCITLNLISALVNQKFKLVVYAQDTVGAKGLSISNTMNGLNGLTLFAGRNSAAVGGSALATTLRYVRSLARSPANGDTYLLEESRILKIDAATGNISHWGGIPNNFNLAIGATPLTTSFSSGGGNNMIDIPSIRIDNNQNIYWSANGRLLKYNHSTALIEIFAGPELGASTTSGTHRLHFNASFRKIFFGKNNAMYFTTIITDGPRSCPVLVRLENDDTLTIIAGSRICNSSVETPLDGDSPLDVYAWGGFSIVPGGESTDDTIYFGSGPWNDARIYKVNPILGTVEFVLEPNITYGLNLGPYLPIRGHIPYTGSGTAVLQTYFIDPSDPNAAQPQFTTIQSQGTGVIDIIEDNEGGVYYLGDRGTVVTYLDPSNTPTSFAGVDPSFGDGGLAIFAELRGVESILHDALGNAYIHEQESQKSRKIDAVTGIITTASNQTVDRNMMARGVGDFIFAKNPYGLVNTIGNCVYFCGNNTKPLASAVNTSPDVVNELTVENGVGNASYPSSYYSNNFLYVGISDTLYNGGNTQRRSTLKKINLSDNSMTTIAGNVTGLPYFDFYSVPDPAIGSTLLDNQFAFLPGQLFEVAQDIVFQIVNNKILSGAENDVWVRQTNTNATSLVVRQSDARMYFFDGLTLKYLDYSPTGSNIEQTIADFTGVLSAPALRAHHDDGVNEYLYISSGNSMYRFEL